MQSFAFLFHRQALLPISERQTTVEVVKSLGVKGLYRGTLAVSEPAFLLTMIMSGECPICFI